MIDPMTPHKLVFIGDSITDANRARPVGEGVIDRPLGDGYVALMEAILTAHAPGHRVRFANMGVSGNTSRELAARFATDVVDLGANHVVIMIGVNDVWRIFTRANWTDWQISPVEFERTLNGVLHCASAAGIGMTLATLFFIESNRKDAMRARMDEFSDIVRRLAAQEQTGLADTQAALDAALRRLHPTQLALDRVHVNLAGHMILAQAVGAAVFGAAWPGITATA
jgi:lysophospholipase L1-like esterase